MDMYNTNVIDNSMYGRILSQGNPSLSQDNHGEQVVPDHHQVTVQIKDTIKIGVWNVRTLYQCGKIENVIQEMKCLKVNIMAVCETRWKRSGHITTEDHWIIYAGGESHKRGVAMISD